MHLIRKQLISDPDHRPKASAIILILFLGINCSINDEWEKKHLIFTDLYENEKYIESKSAAEDALTIALDIYNAGHPSTILSYINLGKAFTATDDITSGERNLTIAQTAIEKYFDNQHILYAVNCLHIGNLFRLKGDLDKALKYLTQANEYFKKIDKVQTHDYANTLEHIALISFTNYNLNDAEDLFRKSLSIREKYITDKQNSLSLIHI